MPWLNEDLRIFKRQYRKAAFFKKHIYRSLTSVKSKEQGAHISLNGSRCRVIIPESVFKLLTLSLFPHLASQLSLPLVLPSYVVSSRWLFLVPCSLSHCSEGFLILGFFVSQISCLILKSNSPIVSGHLTFLMCHRSDISPWSMIVSTFVSKGTCLPLSCARVFCSVMYPSLWPQSLPWTTPSASVSVNLNPWFPFKKGDFFIVILSAV